MLSLVALLLVASSNGAYAEQRFDVSCENIRRIQNYALNGEWTASLMLATGATAAFYRLTAEHIGEDLVIASGGKALFRDRIHSPIPSGIINIKVDSEAEAMELGHTVCPAKVEVHATNPERPAVLVEHPELVVSPPFPVSCNNVAFMEIYQSRDSLWRDKSLEGYFYIVRVMLTEQGSQTLDGVLAATEETQFLIEGRTWAKKHLQLTVQGQRILSDAPNQDDFGAQGAVITKRTLQGAREVTEAICPDKAPAGYLAGRAFGLEIVPFGK